MFSTDSNFCFSTSVHESRERAVALVGLGFYESVFVSFSQQDKNRHHGATSFDDGISVAVRDECMYTFNKNRGTLDLFYRRAPEMHTDGLLGGCEYRRHLLGSTM